jgi:hypothetical protein
MIISKYKASSGKQKWLIMTKIRRKRAMLFNLNDATSACFTAGIPIAGCFSFGK